MTMATCPQCGTELPPTSATCPACQAEVSFWLARAGQVYGPYTRQDLEEARVQRRLAPGDQVKIGQGEWQPLAAVLKAASLPPVAPPPPVQYAASRPRQRDSMQALIIVGAVCFLALVFIPILAAILFPVFAKAREKARQSSCLSNVKQLSLAMLQYCADNDGCLPPRPAAGATPAPFAPDDWRQRIYPYVRNREIFLCPTSQAPDSYGFGEQLYGLEARSVKTPSEVLQLFDKGFLDGSAPPPHSEGYNVGYVDGHCRWVHRPGDDGASP
ncbi:DUF1559 domain-containing protein [bacterium]|nr:DUF1559 domain-containing protein [bacterium]